VYDYVDKHDPVLLRMYEKRKKGYENMGYRIEEEVGFRKGSIFKLLQKTGSKDSQGGGRSATNHYP
jgi:hypothetical protein